MALLSILVNIVIIYHVVSIPRSLSLRYATYGQTPGFGIRSRCVRSVRNRRSSPVSPSIPHNILAFGYQRDDSDNSSKSSLKRTSIQNRLHMVEDHDTVKEKIPITFLAGFLGAGMYTIIFE